MPRIKKITFTRYVYSTPVHTSTSMAGLRSMTLYSLYPEVRPLAKVPMTGAAYGNVCEA